MSAEPGARVRVTLEGEYGYSEASNAPYLRHANGHCTPLTDPSVSVEVIGPVLPEWARDPIAVGIDRLGRVWQRDRVNGYWYTLPSSPFSCPTGRTWDDLLAAFGPIREMRAVS